MSTINFRDPSTQTDLMFKQETETAIPKYKTPDGEATTVIGLETDSATNNNVTRDCFGAFFAACACAISDKKFKTGEPSAIIFSKHADEKNPEFVAALVSVPNGDSYTFKFTYVKEDIDGITNVVDFCDYKNDRNIPFTGMFDSHMIKAHRIAIMDKTIIAKLAIICLTVIRNYLDSVANENEKMELVIDDIFNYSVCNAEEYANKLQPFAVASVEVERGGNKKMEIVFSDQLLVIAKDGIDNIPAE